MSLDAQHRPPEALEQVSEYVRAGLRALGYTFTGKLIACAECGELSVLHVQHDLVDHDWLIGCERCGHRNERTYSDPIRAILMWNANQVERAQWSPQDGLASQRAPWPKH